MRFWESGHFWLLLTSVGIFVCGMLSAPRGFSDGFITAAVIGIVWALVLWREEQISRMVIEAEIRELKKKHPPCDSFSIKD